MLKIRDYGDEVVIDYRPPFHEYIKSVLVLSWFLVVFVFSIFIVIFSNKYWLMLSGGLFSIISLFAISYSLRSFNQYRIIINDYFYIRSFPLFFLSKFSIPTKEIKKFKPQEQNLKDTNELTAKASFEPMLETVNGERINILNTFSADYYSSEHKELKKLFGILDTRINKSLDEK